MKTQLWSESPIVLSLPCISRQNPWVKEKCIASQFYSRTFCLYMFSFVLLLRFFLFFSKQDLMKVKIVDYSLSYDQGSWLLIILLPSHEFWDYRHMLPYSDLSFVFKEHLTDYVSIPFCTFFNFSFLRPYIIL